MYWINARSAFTPSAVDNDLVAGCSEEMTDSVITTSGGAILCNPTIGENWQYGFTTAKETLANAGDWANAEVTIHNAKIAVTNEAGSGVTVKDAGNGLNGETIDVTVVRF